MKLLTIAAFARRAGVSRQYVREEITRGDLTPVIIAHKQYAGGIAFTRTQLAIDVDAETTIAWLSNPRRGSVAAARRAKKGEGSET